MFRTLISTTLILGLLACPYVCRAGWCSAVESAVQHESKPRRGCCAGCGRHTAAESKSAATDRQDRKAPSFGDEQNQPRPDVNGQCNCICGGAIESLAVELRSEDVAKLAALPDVICCSADLAPAVSAPGGHAPPFDSVRHSGRALRTLLASLLC